MLSFVGCVRIQIYLLVFSAYFADQDCIHFQFQWFYLHNGFSFFEIGFRNQLSVFFIVRIDFQIVRDLQIINNNNVGIVVEPYLS